MSKENTFVKLYRGIEDHWLWDDKPFSKGQAWIDLIMMANHRDVRKPYKGKIVTFKRGTVSRSIKSLAGRWGWSRHKVIDFLSLLESDRMITKNGTTQGTTITIENYNSFQDKPTTKGQQKDSERDSERTSKGHPADTNKNEKNDKEYLYPPIESPHGGPSQTKKNVFTPPTLDEVKAYCLERHNSVDASMFIDFYESKGWTIGKNKMKDWKAAVRTWERRNNEYTGPQEEPGRNRNAVDWDAITANG